MSRRKQRFPLHHSDEELNTCQSETRSPSGIELGVSEEGRSIIEGNTLDMAPSKFPFANHLHMDGSGVKNEAVSPKLVIGTKGNSLSRSLDSGEDAENAKVFIGSKKCNGYLSFSNLDNRSLNGNHNTIGLHSLGTNGSKTERSSHILESNGIHYYTLANGYGASNNGEKDKIFYKNDTLDTNNMSNSCPEIVSKSTEANYVARKKIVRIQPKPVCKKEKASLFIREESPDSKKRSLEAVSRPTIKSDSRFICPVCSEKFKTKRSFNSHILVHCQLVKSPIHSNKRGFSEVSPDFPNKKSLSEVSAKNDSIFHTYMNKESICPTSLPLDLSCKKSIERSECFDIHTRVANMENIGRGSHPESSFSSLSSPSPPQPSMSSESPPDKMANMNGFPQGEDRNLSILSERSPFEDENENLVNEAREHEKAFFDLVQNEIFLSEDSSGLDPPPPLPILQSGGVTKEVKVWNEEGSPMVYSIKYHAEQIFVSRILGINEETGDKIELYKCFMCNLSFPSVSRLQAHLLVHKQKFQCRKCQFSCDSRVQFSQHVQKEHVANENSREVARPINEDSLNAENTVTVAALLSALHGNTRSEFPLKKEQESSKANGREEEYDEEILRREEFSLSPISPPESQVDQSENGSENTERDIFKMFSCRFCGKKFDRAFSCNRHERVHTGYKPCFCRICGRGFSEPRNLRHHVIRFHSDGSLRHLIKRDRRKKNDENSSSSDSSIKDAFGDGGVKCGSSNPILGSLLMASRRESPLPSSFCPQENMEESENSISNYTSNLTKIFSASLDSSSRIKKSKSNSPSPESQAEHMTLTFTSVIPNVESQNVASKGFGNTSVTTGEKPYNNSAFDVDKRPYHDTVLHIDEDNYNSSSIQIISDPTDQLEPGEIRLSSRTKIVDDGERGRRLVIDEDDQEEGQDHSPQFSSYAPRLHIIDEPVNRDKALLPITDDIGRTFYECPYCYKFFGSTSDLNRHLDFHEDLRPYDCQYCDYSARTNSQLKVHKMRHEGIKQFSCDVCNYNGVTQSDLNRHKKTQSHIARCRNVCAVCGLGFYSASQKQIHIYNCHPEMEGASSLIQMSLGLPPSAPPEIQVGISGATSNSSSNGPAPAVNPEQM